MGVGLGLSLTVAGGCVLSEPVGDNPEDTEGSGGADGGSDTDDGIDDDPDTDDQGGTGDPEEGATETGEPPVETGGEVDANGCWACNIDGASSDTCCPPDEPAPVPFFAAGGDVSIDVSGPGPWVGSPDATLEWSKDWHPDDSDGMRCQWGATTYSVFSFTWAGERNGVDRRYTFSLNLDEFDGPGTYEVGPGDEGHFEFDWWDDPFASRVDPDAFRVGASTDSGTCTVTLDELWWGGTVECTGLAAEVQGETAEDYGPFDLSIEWRCQALTP